MVAPVTRIDVLDDARAHDVFEVLGLEGGIARVKTAFLFEVGEELVVRIYAGAEVTDAVVRVRTHVGPPEARVTWLEIVQRSQPRAPTHGGGA